MIGKTMLIAVVAVAFAVSQTPSPAVRAAFEVASVKLNVSGSDKAFIQALPGRLEITNVALRRLIVLAFGVQDYQILGDPPWIGSDHYDIRAKAGSNVSVAQMEGPLLQALLEDRFRLVLHRETRQLPVYDLTVAKGGVKMEPTKEGSCTPYSVDSPPAPSAAGEPQSAFCGFHRSPSDGLNRSMEGAGVSMAVLCANLSRSYVSDLGRTVIDKTGLPGTFDVHLKWSVDNLTGAAGSAASDGSGSALPAANLVGNSIFTAVQEQLGLRLESGKGSVDVLVIDRIEKPSAN